jgi:hypothetical protein
MIRNWLGDLLTALATLASVLVLVAIYVRDRNAMELV